MEENLYLSKKFADDGTELVSVGIKADAGTIGYILHLPASTFYSMVETLRESRGENILYIKER